MTLGLMVRPTWPFTCPLDKLLVMGGRRRAPALLGRPSSPNGAVLPIIPRRNVRTAGACCSLLGFRARSLFAHDWGPPVTMSRACSVLLPSASEYMPRCLVCLLLPPSSSEPYGGVECEDVSEACVNVGITCCS
jgi:hypothetical protein